MAVYCSATTAFRACYCTTKRGEWNLEAQNVTVRYGSPHLWCTNLVKSGYKSHKRLVFELQGQQCKFESCNCDSCGTQGEPYLTVTVRLCSRCQLKDCKLKIPEVLPKLVKTGHTSHKLLVLKWKRQQYRFKMCVNCDSQETQGERYLKVTFGVVRFCSLWQQTLKKKQALNREPSTAFPLQHFCVCSWI